MKIPSDAIISREKLTRYLLVRRPQNDKSGFLALGGFDLASADLLEREIRRLTTQTDAAFDRVTEHGAFYTVDGEVVGPVGAPLAVKLVWLHRIDGVWSFVTLVPGNR